MARPRPARRPRIPPAPAAHAVALAQRLAALATVAALAALAPARTAHAQDRAEDHPRPGRPFPRPTLAWVAGQLLPSPGVLFTENGTYAHVSWQLTPVLYSFGVHRGVFPLRTVVVEPSARQGGAVELFLSPEFAARPGPATQQWAVRVGARLYVPVVQHGDNLSVSLAVSDLIDLEGRHAVGYELGAYALFGLFGVQVTYSPRTRDGQALLLALRIRYF